MDSPAPQRPRTTRKPQSRRMGLYLVGY
jgi:hypothetical protein